ncbi:MAG: Hsp20/alpha crystallin family protein [Chloroflexi bacterium]|jgi:HSP20 family protein|nr:Hsp20/alpha crystallin family protein [Chloroflexota bacterium]MBT3668684.1 Hsp20/alpha crystallin family protein [Chloroflexota bacterium]MBT4003519.1 Hsp20/alpha crystallin family protein [Chloroflexota bacterium]MBT4305385.1 Hsp20/alpha crystallin family protein [Chloroflexota bacterium]MBT4532531.1 Hsp20/alpha crystallin family protein [Chloroflexota bacterium]
MKNKTTQNFSPQDQSSGEPRFVISGVYRQTSFQAHIWRPPTDVFETENDIVVRMEIAGMRDSEFNIGLEKRILSIRGGRPPLSEHGAYYQMEINTGEFLSLVELPTAVEFDQINAEYQDGFLTIVLPKAITQRIDVNQK